MSTIITSAKNLHKYYSNMVNLLTHDYSDKEAAKVLSGMSEESRDRLMQNKAAMEKIIGDAQTYTTLC